jgi:tetratricopeptide (TPR) repeat protein
VAIDREKILQAAQKLVDKKKYDQAVKEYEKIIAEDPQDTRTLLKIGDLQSRMEAYPLAIATYDRVAQHYASQGFSLKAIAVYKQIRELIRKHAPQLVDRYGHIVPRLAEIYSSLGLTTDALAAYDEVATRYQKAARDRDAIDVFRKMVSLDAKNPLPHLRLAEACCRVQSLDDAIDSFWTASELLLGMNRPDDALKVIERILHFRQDPVYARAAAELLLKRGGRENGMQALAKLQVAFQADPKNLDTLALLAEAFSAIEQREKALAVHIEMARLAREQGKQELFKELLAHLKSVAPTNEQVLALEKAGPRSVAPPPPPPASTRADDTDAQGIPVATDDDEEAVELDDEVELIDDEVESVPASVPLSVPLPAPRPPSSMPVPPAPPLPSLELPPARRVMASAPDVEIEEGVEIVTGAVAEEVRSAPRSFDAAAHARKAIVDAESFRKLGLYDKAVEALHIALEIDPNSIDIRQKLREILVEAGEREPAIAETINIATIYLHLSEPDEAEALLMEILDIEPGHTEALNLLRQAAYFRTSQAESMPMSSYDLEGVRPSQAMGNNVDEPFGDDGRLPSFPLSEAPTELRAGADSLEEVLEEAEFFAAQGLFSDAEAILGDQLRRLPNHPLLMERLQEVRQAREAAQGHSGTIEKAQVERSPSDHSFDIAASLDALDVLEKPANRPQLAGAAEEVDVDQVFAKFKEGVRATVAESDAATHYDLGVAYKEMGLLPDACSEFELASRDPQRTCMCYGMIGMIHREQGQLDEASKAYLRALEAEHKTPEQELSLFYDLGCVYDESKDAKSALYYFEKISRTNPSYRDVSQRIKKLSPAQQKAVGDDDDFDAAFDGLFDK